MKLLFAFAALATTARAYWLMGIENFITTERLDPVVNPGRVSGHAHSVLGGSNFRAATNTSFLRQSDCTSVPIPQDKSAYWFPHLYFQWNNGSFTSLNGGAVICKQFESFDDPAHLTCLSDYLFSDKPGTTTAFPDDFRMISGDPTLRTYDPTSSAQRAITFLCLDFNGQSIRYPYLPTRSCPSGIRAEVNFPSCWDGKNTDSPDHKSHVAFLSGGPDSGTCSDPRFPKTLPRIFMEVYWGSQDFDKFRSQARNASQPFVFAHGDPTGYGYHADFINGWQPGVLQKAVDNCHCNPYGDPKCCADQGIFDLTSGKKCRITPSLNEQTTGTLLRLPGNNPVQPEGKKATIYPDDTNPQWMAPVYAYTGNQPAQVGAVVGANPNAPVAAAPTAVASPASSAQASSHPVASASAAPATSKATVPTPVTTPVATPVATQAPANPTTTKKGLLPGLPISLSLPIIGVIGGKTAAPAPAVHPTPSPLALVSSNAPAAEVNSNSDTTNHSETQPDAETCHSGASKKRRSNGFEKHRRSRKARAAFEEAAQLPHVRHVEYEAYGSSN